MKKKKNFFVHFCSGAFKVKKKQLFVKYFFVENVIKNKLQQLINAPSYKTLFTCN